MSQEFEDLYRDYFVKIYRFLYNVTGERQLAEELAQETFIKAYQKLDTFRQEARITVWLHKIAYHQMIDYKRKKTAPSISLEEINLEGHLFEEGKKLLNQVEQKLMSDCVQSKIQLLPENYRTALYFDMQGYSDLEIANIMACTLDNAKVRLRRARNKMKEILGKDCSFYYDERNVLC